MALFTHISPLSSNGTPEQPQPITEASLSESIFLHPNIADIVASKIENMDPVTGTVIPTTQSGIQLNHDTGKITIPGASTKPTPTVNNPLASLSPNIKYVFIGIAGIAVILIIKKLLK
jgi:hypothetical protein